MENVSKRYRLGNELKEAVANLELRVMQGEFAIVEGLCGIQKNAFFNLIGCLERPDAGKYYYDYEDVALAGTALLDELRKHRIGYLFRDFNLIPRMSVAQNMEVTLAGASMSRREKTDRIKAALEKLDILELLEEKASSLPDYKKQLVSLARAIVNSPLMILADEPSANLGNKEEQALMEQLERLNNEGITIILITEKKTLRDPNKHRLITFSADKPLSDKEAYKFSLIRREA